MRHPAKSIESISIGQRRIGAGSPAFIIAEAGVNHNGNLDTALEMIDVAVRSGADAIKFQTFRTEALVTADAQKADYQKETTGGAESQFQMLKKLELSFGEFERIIEHCSLKDIMFLSTPFDEKSADFLHDAGMKAFKIPSGEVTNIPFLQHVAEKNRPMIMSTGMCTLVEVNQAVQAIKNTGNLDLVLLHCVSSYPAPADTVNLRAMNTLADAFRFPVGYSDHTLGTEIAVAAVAMGAVVIEKHFTLDKTQEGPDHQASMEPAELENLVRAIRRVESAMGDGSKRPSACESSVACAARKSLTAACDIVAGTVLEKKHLVVRRPGTGLPPSMLPITIGCRTRVSIDAGTPITADMVTTDVHVSENTELAVSSLSESA